MKTCELGTDDQGDYVAVTTAGKEVRYYNGCTNGGYKKIVYACGVDNNGKPTQVFTAPWCDDGYICTGNGLCKADTDPGVSRERYGFTRT